MKVAEKCVACRKVFIHDEKCYCHCVVGNHLGLLPIEEWNFIQQIFKTVEHKAFEAGRTGRSYRGGIEYTYKTYAQYLERTE